jgi:hypothetical protein
MAQLQRQPYLLQCSLHLQQHSEANTVHQREVKYPAAATAAAFCPFVFNDAIVDTLGAYSQLDTFLVRNLLSFRRINETSLNAVISNFSVDGHAIVANALESSSWTSGALYDYPDADFCLFSIWPHLLQQILLNARAPFFL